MTLAELRASLTTAKITASSPAHLGDEAEQIAREDRWS